MSPSTKNFTPATKSFTPGTIYLCFYNVTLSLGWAILMIQFVSHMIYGDGLPGLWDATHVGLLLFQSLAVLEVVHAAVGLVKSNVLLTFFQVLSRVGLVWMVLYSFPPTRSSIGFPMVLFAWCLTEIIRYQFYFLGLIGVVPSFLVFLRYTLFIVLYPMGVVGEWLCYLVALPIIEKTRPFTISLPNSINFTFDSYYGVLLMLALYIPVFPQLYLHMMAQRKKVLSPRAKAE